VANFADRLVRLRKAAGLSQTDLAGDDLSPSYVSLLEAGKRKPSTDVVRQLAARLGCSSSMLWEGEHSERERRLSLEISYAKLALTHGGLTDARDRLVLLLDEPDLDLHRRDEATLLLGFALEQTGQFQQAIELLTPLFARSIKGQSHLPPSSVGAKLCTCYLEVGDANRGVSVGQEALDAALVQGLGGTEEYFRLGAILLWGHLELGNLSHAMAWARRLIVEAEQDRTVASGAAVYWNAALLADSMGDLSEALHLSERALGQLAESEDSPNLVRLKLAIADMQLRTDPPQAHEAEASLAAIEERVLDMGGQVDVVNWHCLTAIARVLSGDLSSARSQAAAAREVMAQLDQHEITVDALIVSGDVTLASGLTGEAAGHYDAAVRRLTGLPVRRGLVRVWRELGDRFRALGDHRSAAECYEQALTAARIPDRSHALRARIFATLTEPAG
jgi:transcriptional regulator with XRE-family HTH domain